MSWMQFSKSRPCNPIKHERMKRAIEQCVAEGVYPSARQINHHMGRNGVSLNGSECVTRRIIFKQLNIHLKKVGWADVDDGEW